MFSSWLSKCSANKERLLEDVEALMETSKQTSFLYTLAHQLYKHLGTEVETKVSNGNESSVVSQQISFYGKMAILGVEYQFKVNFWGGIHLFF